MCRQSDLEQTGVDDLVSEVEMKQIRQTKFGAVWPNGHQRNLEFECRWILL